MIPVPRIRLRTKVLAGMALVLLPLLGLLLFGLAEQYAMRRSSLFNGMRQTADASGLVVDGALQAAMELAQTLAADAASVRLDAQELRPFLERVRREREDLANLAVFGIDGKALVSLTPATDAFRLDDRPYFQRVLQTREPVLSHVLVGRGTNQPITVAAAPILDAEHRVRGVVAVALRLESLEQRMQDIRLRPGQALFVTDPTGRLAFHSDHQVERWEQRDLATHPAIRALLDGTPTSTPSHRGLFADEQRIFAVIHSPEWGWPVGVTWSVEAAFQELNQVRRMQLAAFVAIALLALAGAWLLASYLVGRVERLVAQARALERGEFTHEATNTASSRLNTGDELEELSEAFTHMAAELRRERERRNTFISSVAHDLRNVLSPLTLTAQALREPQRLAPGAQAQFAGRLGRQAARAERLVLDLLDASRISTGHFTLEPRAHDLMATARAVVEEQQAGAPEHQVRLQGPEQLEVEADPDRLAQVLTNLVGNAVKYSPAGGEVLLEVTAAQDEVHIQVRDTGIGLLPQELATLFQPYQRAHGARAFEGLGLGLSICHAIVRAHGGTISVRSAGRDRGSIFDVRLPLRAPPQASA